MGGNQQQTNAKASSMMGMPSELAARAKEDRTRSDLSTIDSMASNYFYRFKDPPDGLEVRKYIDPKYSPEGDRSRSKEDVDRAVMSNTPNPFLGIYDGSKDTDNRDSGTMWYRTDNDSYNMNLQGVGNPSIGPVYFDPIRKRISAHEQAHRRASSVDPSLNDLYNKSMSIIDQYSKEEDPSYKGKKTISFEQAQKAFFDIATHPSEVYADSGAIADQLLQENPQFLDLVNSGVHDALIDAKINNAISKAFNNRDGVYNMLQYVKVYRPDYIPGMVNQMNRYVKHNLYDMINDKKKYGYITAQVSADQYSNRDLDNNLKRAV